MRIEDRSISKRYALAYMSIKDGSDEKKIENLKKIIDAAEKYAFYMDNPVLPFNIKIDVLKNAVPHNLLNSKAFSFVSVIIKSKRFYLINDILKECEDIMIAKKDEMKISVSSRYPLTESDKEMLSAFIKDVFKKKAVIEWHENKNSAGGFIIRCNDIIIDSTLDKKIERLKKTIIEGDII